MDSLFDEIDSTLLLLLFLASLAKAENETVEESGTIEEKPEEGLGGSAPEPEPSRKESCYIYRSGNKKRLKPRAVYF